VVVHGRDHGGGVAVVVYLQTSLNLKNIELKKKKLINLSSKDIEFDFLISIERLNKQTEIKLDDLPTQKNCYKM
jgi:hypothetical protein